VGPEVVEDQFDDTEREELFAAAVDDEIRA
jgi:hypothetical protein